MQTENKILNVLGDSITQGASASDYSRIYHQVLKELGAFKQVRSYGVGGTRIARQFHPSACADWDRNFIMRAKEMDKCADMVLVFGGTNDYGHGDAPFGEIGDNTEDTFCGACKVLFENLRADFPNATIIVLLPLHRVNEDNIYGEFGNKATRVGTLEDYSNALKTVAEQFNFPVCSLRGDALLNPNDPQLNAKYFSDGLHPNDAGHKLLAERIFEFIQKL